MTRFRSFLRSTLAAAALATAVPATAGDYVFAVPQSLERDQARQVHQDIMTFVTQTAAAGDVIRVVDATAVKTIAVFAIPDGSAAGIANLRKRAVAEGMTAWNRFVKEHYVNAPEGAPEIFLPQLLSHLATQTYADQNPHERDICVLVVGSALYHDAREPDFDMRDGRFPSDGLILASQGRSPYGTADRQGQLRGIHVNLLTLDRTWASDIHQLRVHRTWHLLIDAQGGTLATFTQDPETARARFADCERKPGRTFAWDSSRTLQTMLSHERASTLHQTTKQPEITQKQQTPQKPQTISQIPDEVSSEIASIATEAPVFESTPSEALKVELANDDWLRNDAIVSGQLPPAVERANLKLGMRWGDDGDCADVDLDLYVRSAPDRPYLYFSNVSSPDGQYHKDHLTAPGVRNGLEFVDITDQVQLSELEVLINFYGGVCENGPKGIVRAYVNGTAYELPFHLVAETGNRGADRNTSTSSPHWVRIDQHNLFRFEGGDVVSVEPTQ